MRPDADLFAVRKSQKLSIPLPATTLLDPKPPNRLYRNPVFYAMELNRELVENGLTRKQLADRHGITSDRITQILLVLELPEDQLTEVIALGDHWSRQVVTERELRRTRLVARDSDVPSLLKQAHR